MVNFQIDNELYDRCNNLLNKCPECESLLFSIATGFRNNQLLSLNSTEIEALSPSISLNIIVVENEYANFTDHDELMTYLLAREACKTRLLDKFDNHIAFCNEFEIICRESILDNAINKVSSAALVILNNGFNKDICKLVLLLTSNNLWSVLDAFANAIPFLKIDVDSIVELMRFTEGNVEKNIPKYSFYSALEKLSMIQPKNGEVILNKLKEKKYLELVPFIPPILVGLDKGTGLKTIYEDTLLFLEDEDYLQVGIISLSLFNYGDEMYKGYLRKTLDKYKTLLDANPTSQVVSVVTRAYGNLLKYDREIHLCLSELSYKDDPDVRYELSNILFHNAHLLDELWYKEILIRFSSTEKQYSEIIRNLEYCLHNYLSKEPAFIFNFFENWVKNHSSEKNETSIVKLFNWIFSDIFNQSKWLIEKYITYWFNSNDERFHPTAAEIVQNYAVDNGNLILGKEQLNELPDEDVEFVIIKIMGYVLWNSSLCSLIFSVLQRKPESDRINSLVIEAFEQYISYNYPGVTREFLQSKVDNGTGLEKLIIDRIITTMDKYSNQLNKHPRLKEFHPPERRAMTYLNMKARKQNKEMTRKTEEGSVLSQLVSHVFLKGGKNSFTKYDGNFTDRSGLHEMSYSYELPRGEIFDPVGQQYMRYQWRIKKRNEVENEINYP